MPEWKTYLDLAIEHGAVITRHPDSEFPHHIPSGGKTVVSMTALDFEGLCMTIFNSGKEFAQDADNKPEIFSKA